MLPATLPLFPLPNVVLFPNVFLPLHIFEPRYRAMVRDALAGDRMIGMVLLKPGFEADYEGRPSVYDIGCAGVITHSEPLPDGRFNIVLRGLEKFRIASEREGQPYRLAQVDALDEPLDDGARMILRRQRQKLEEVLSLVIERGVIEAKIPPSIPDEDLVNALAQYLPLEPVERQALLERDGLTARCEALTELLEMRTLTPGVGWNGGAVH